ncbi:MAG: hypothetical protein FD167_5834, partial [bacterium]
YIGDNEAYNTTYSYNGADELTGIRDSYRNNFNFTYDSLGSKIQLNDPDLGTWQYQYYLSNNLIKQTDNRGQLTRLSYDSLNRLLRKDYTEESTILTYDKQYQSTLYNASLPNVTYTYTYDDRLRIIKEIATLENLSFETGNNYDSMDRVIKKILPDSAELDFYYNQMNKLDKIKGYINKTSYNAFGLPTNRTYFNSRITKFDYNQQNARLRQISTDNIQQLNYTYDNIGNIISINDSINNRSYSMSYDNLDRLTNVTINPFSWVYSYDSIGRILKVIRNSSQTTSMKYGFGPVHAPYRVITTDTGIDIYKLIIYNTTNRTQIIQFYIVNEKNTSLTNINYSIEFGDNFVFNSTPLNLA